MKVDTFNLSTGGVLHASRYLFLQWLLSCHESEYPKLAEERICLSVHESKYPYMQVNTFCRKSDGGL